MRIIKDLVAEIDDELAGAREYAKNAVHNKTSNPTLAKAYYDMAVDELKHADMLHTEVVKMIDKQRSIAPPPQIMLDMWEDEHKDYVEDAAHIKYMLSLYAK